MAHGPEAPQHPSELTAHHMAFMSLLTEGRSYHRNVPFSSCIQTLLLTYQKKGSVLLNCFWTFYLITLKEKNPIWHSTRTFLSLKHLIIFKKKTLPPLCLRLLLDVLLLTHPFSLFDSSQFYLMDVGTNPYFLYSNSWSILYLFEGHLVLPISLLCQRSRLHLSQTIITAASTAGSKA